VNVLKCILVQKVGFLKYKSGLLHGHKMKIINAQQAKTLNIYKNTKSKLLKTKAAIWFNKMYRLKGLKPNYISIRINGNTLRDKKTTQKAISYRLNQEIKHLCRKKQHLNQLLYQQHLKGANQYNDMLLHNQRSTKVSCSK